MVLLQHTGLFSSRIDNYGNWQEVLCHDKFLFHIFSFCCTFIFRVCWRILSNGTDLESLFLEPSIMRHSCTLNNTLNISVTYAPHHPALRSAEARSLWCWRDALCSYFVIDHWHRVLSCFSAGKFELGGGTRGSILLRDMRGVWF